MAAVVIVIAAAAADRTVPLPPPPPPASAPARGRSRLALAVGDAVLCLCLAKIWLLVAGQTAVDLGRVVGCGDGCCLLISVGAAVVSVCGDWFMLETFGAIFLIFLSRAEDAAAEEQVPVERKVQAAGREVSHACCDADGGDHRYHLPALDCLHWRSAGGLLAGQGVCHGTGWLRVLGCLDLGQGRSVLLHRRSCRCSEAVEGDAAWVAMQRCS
ncbi:unnamed protein product [Urochloa humidicola]